MIMRFLGQVDTAIKISTIFKNCSLINDKMKLFVKKEQFKTHMHVTSKEVMGKVMRSKYLYISIQDLLKKIDFENV